jgi:hypothetical protein
MLASNDPGHRELPRCGLSDCPEPQQGSDAVDREVSRGLAAEDSLTSCRRSFCSRHFSFHFVFSFSQAARGSRVAVVVVAGVRSGDAFFSSVQPATSSRYLLLFCFSSSIIASLICR